MTTSRAHYFVEIQFRISEEMRKVLENHFFGFVFGHSQSVRLPSENAKTMILIWLNETVFNWHECSTLKYYIKMAGVQTAKTHT